jgi:hypothetical protein
MNAELRRLVILTVELRSADGDLIMGSERMLTLDEKEPLSYWKVLELCDDLMNERWIMWEFKETEKYWIFGRTEDGSVLMVLRPPGEPLADAPGSCPRNAV